jgi:hypothetical protein
MVETWYGWSAEEIVQDDTGVRVTIASRSSAERKTLRADYAVGCDGSHSLVREQVGIGQTLSDHDRLMVLLVFRSTGLHELLKRYPGKSFYNVLHPDLNGYWQFFGRVDLGTNWFFHAPVPPGTTEDNFDFRRLLQTAVGSEFDVEFDHIGFWDLRFAVANTYRKGRIFIAGDSAHSHPPYGGYGINSGFEDAVNLGWKLAAAMHGWGGESLLNSYDAERRAVFVSTAQDFIEKAIQQDRDFLREFDPVRDRTAFENAWNARMASVPAEVNKYEPHYEGSPIVWGPQGSVSSATGSHSLTARPGHHLTPQPLSSGKNVFDELSDGHVLLALDAVSKDVQAFERAAKAIGMPLKVVEDTRAAGREKYGAALILIRPDQFVAWISDGGSVDATEVLSRVIGRPVR